MVDMNRGQAHTLEGVMAGLILLSALTFALQATAVTPLSASTSSQHIENQQQATAESVLAAAAENGSLKRAVLFWGYDSTDEEYEFLEADNGPFYTSKVPPNVFGRMLTRSFNGRGIAFNVYVVYQAPGGGERRQPIIYRGEPSDNSVTASEMVTLVDDDVLFEKDLSSDGDRIAEPTTTVISETDNFYAPDAAPNSDLYNVLKVEVVTWRM